MSVFSFGGSMPKIGLRSIKTAIAVMFTMLLNLILTLISPTFAQTWYSPFFAGIAAVYSMQREHAQSFRLARIRSLGSLFGGLFGMVLVLFHEAIFQPWLLANYGPIGDMIVLYTLTSVFTVVLIYLLVAFKQHDLVWVAALTYLSVTISLRNNLPVYFFAINRISSTTIGVLITLLVNQFHLYRFHHKEILFVSGLDQCLLTKEKKLTSYTTYTMNGLLNEGLNFTVSTTRTPASLSKIFANVPLHQELMIMNGAVIYDMNKEMYLDIKSIPKKAQEHVDKYFKMKERNVFAYTIIDQALSIYHTSFANEAEEKFYYDRKNDYFRNHIKGHLDPHESAVFYIMIDRKDVIDTYIQDLTTLDTYEHLSFQVYPYDFFDDYYFLKIYSSKASKENALNEFIKRHEKEMTIAFGSKSFDVEFMKLSDVSITLSSADQEALDVADIVLPSDHPDTLVKLMKKLFHHKDPKGYLEQLKQQQK
ncbi:MAG: hypothetical protein C4537_07015 [Acholeplasma sp.]|jgi:hydroxymethylpyrimidine pyrophosphatase-like HAD family hydrolase|nr:MAG: hypothetical protein C4537_07015 [Acholeplasma sp.]